MGTFASHSVFRLLLSLLFNILEHPLFSCFGFYLAATQHRPRRHSSCIVTPFIATRTASRRRLNPTVRLSVVREHRVSIMYRCFRAGETIWGDPAMGVCAFFCSRASQLFRACLLLLLAYNVFIFSIAFFFPLVTVFILFCQSSCFFLSDADYSCSCHTTAGRECCSGESHSPETPPVKSPRFMVRGSPLRFMFLSLRCSSPRTSTFALRKFSDRFRQGSAWYCVPCIFICFSWQLGTIVGKISDAKSRDNETGYVNGEHTRDNEEV